MSESDTERDPIGDVLNEELDELDEELLALSPPPPGIQELLLTLLVLGFSALILALFWPELRYFMRAGGDPSDLGEAANVRTGDLIDNDYVKLDAVPLINRTISFRTGTKWFSADIYRRMAPVSGNSALYVQWASHNPAIRQEKDTLTPPAVFSGRLRHRDRLSANYEKFWPFFDCLSIHDTSRCKFCIGRTTMAACRPVYTCVDHYPIELCDWTAFFSQSELADKAAQLERDYGAAAPDEVRKRIQDIRRARDAHAHIAILSDLMWMEELSRRLELLPQEARTTAGDAVLSTKRQLLSRRTEALQIRMRPLIARMKGLSPTLRAELENTAQTLSETEHRRDQLASHTEEIGHLADITRELLSLRDLIRELEGHLETTRPAPAALSEWTLDPTASGEQILARMGDLEALLATERRSRAEQADDSSADQSESPDRIPASPEDTPENIDTAAVSTDLDPPHTERNPDPEVGRIRGILDDVRRRINALGRALNTLSPGDLPALDRWAASVDIVGSLPRALRMERVMVALSRLEEWTGSVTGDAQETLRTRHRQLASQLEAEHRNIEQLRKTSGLLERELTESLSDLLSAQKNVVTLDDVNVVERQYQTLHRVFSATDLYPRDLANFPTTQKALSALITNSDLSSLEQAVASLEDRFKEPVYLLLDRERPTDSPWVLFVALVIPIMMALNLRRLWRWIRAHRG